MAQATCSQILDYQISILVDKDQVPKHGVACVTARCLCIAIFIKGLLGVDFTQYGVLLIPMLMTKIPEEIRLMITRLTKKDDWALEGFLKIFLQELEAREQCSLNSEISSGGSAQRAARSPMSTTAALLNNGGMITCTYCKGSHASVKCNVITEPLARKTILQRHICLK